MYSLNWSMSHPVYLLSVHRTTRWMGLEDFRTKRERARPIVKAAGWLCLSGVVGGKVRHYCG